MGSFSKFPGEWYVLPRSSLAPSLGRGREAWRGRGCPSTALTQRWGHSRGQAVSSWLFPKSSGVFSLTRNNVQ